MKTLLTLCLLLLINQPGYTQHKDHYIPSDVLQSIIKMNDWEALNSPKMSLSKLHLAKINNPEAFLLDSIIIKTYLPFSDQWLNNTKIIIEYSNEGFQLQYRSLTWAEQEEKWLNNTKRDYSLNSENLAISHIDYRWDTDANIWNETLKRDFIRNEKGLFEQVTGYNWDDINEQWINANTRFYTFDENDHLTDYLQQSWVVEIGDWANTTKEQSIYNDDGYLITFIRENWDKNEADWRFSFKEAYVVDDQGNNIQKDAYLWDRSADIPAWTNYSTETYIVNEAGNTTENIYYAYSNGTAFQISKTTYSYGETDRRAQVLKYLWNEDDWIISQRTNYVYDDQGNNTQQLNANWQELWQESSQNDYYYSPLCVTNVPAIMRAPSVKIYPNPASNFLVVEAAEVTQSTRVVLYDILGKEVLSTPLSVRTKIPLNQLNPGIYFWKIWMGNKLVEGQRIIVY